MKDTCRQRCQIAGHCLKEKESLLPFVKRLPFFLYACVIPFSCQRPLGVSANLSFSFFFLKFNLNFIYLFIRSLHSHLGAGNLSIVVSDEKARNEEQNSTNSMKRKSSVLNDVRGTQIILFLRTPI